MFYKMIEKARDTWYSSENCTVKGAKELDDALVSKPLEWLASYTKARTAWVKALKGYSEQTDENASEIADKFRKALEAFFQEFFNSEKSLENYKTE